MNPHTYAANETTWDGRRRCLRCGELENLRYTTECSKPEAAKEKKDAETS